MNLLEDFMQAVNYRITEGSAFCWRCYGNSAYTLSSWNGKQDGHSVSIVFDTKTQDAYELTVCDYRRKRAYRWINSEYRRAHDDEALSHAPGLENQAWDNVDYVDLETTEDFFNKATAIVNGLPYDERVVVPLDLSDAEILRLALEAHRRDITLNQLVHDAIAAVMDKEEENDQPELPLHF